MSTILVRGVFDSHAEEFDAWFGENRKIYLSELNALRAAGPRGRVLDVGVGSGVFAHRLGASLGVDVSRKMLELSRKRGLQVIQADAKSLPFRDGALDTVVVSFTICFVDDVLGMLKEAFRILNSKGILILGEITLDSKWGRLYSAEGKRGHPFYSRARFFTLGETLSLLSKSGFATESAFGSVSFGPTEEPRVEKATKFKPENQDAFSRYGFVCLRAVKSRSLTQ